MFQESETVFKPQLISMSFENPFSSNKTLSMILGADEGLAKLFAGMVSEYIIITDRSGDGYVWGPKTYLWEKRSSIHIMNSISGVLGSVIQYTINEVQQRDKDSDDEDSEEKDQATLKKLRLIFKYVSSTTGCGKIFTKVISHLQIDGWRVCLNMTPYELPIKNGKLLNLNTLECRQRTRSDLWSWECNVTFNPDLDLAEIESFMLDLTCGNAEYAHWLRKFMGYCMTGEITDRSIYQAWGEGLNGKSFLLDTIMKRIMGNFWGILDDSLLLAPKTGGPSPETLGLMGIRMAVVNETDDGYINGKIAKRISAGDTLEARGLYQNELVKFVNRAKPIIVTNKQLQFDGSDQAMKDRIKFLPFQARFSNDGTVKREKEAWMYANIDRFFTYFAMGASIWYKTFDLKLPKIAADETEERFMDNDSFKRWVNECCELTGEASPTELSNSYKLFCSREGLKNLVPGDLTKKLRTQFGKVQGKYKRYYGVKLKDETHTRFLPAQNS